MKITTGAALLASAGLARAAAIADRETSQALCGQKAYQEGGNWYCQAVGHITYTNVGASGEYDDVVHMDQNIGNCLKAKRPFSGPLAPFNEQVMTPWPLSLLMSLSPMLIRDRTAFYSLARSYALEADGRLYARDEF